MKKKSSYKSQERQDQWVDFLLKGKEKGTFLDIGAHDGISFSNTYFFEKERNWTGICVEPNPDVFRELVKNRSCLLENYCIGDKEGTVTFRKVEGHSNMLSGILDFFDKNHIDRINNEILAYGGGVL